jgi:signal transduction histidine kinase
MKFFSKITFFSAILILVAVISLYLMTEYQISRFLVKEIERRGKVLADNLAYSAQRHLLKRDKIALSFLVTRTMRNEDVVYAKVIDQNNRVIATNSASEYNQSYIPPPGMKEWGKKVLLITHFTSEEGEKLIDFGYLIKIGEQEIGEVHIGLSKTSGLNLLISARRKNISLILAFFLLGILGMVILSKSEEKKEKQAETDSSSLVTFRGTLGYKIGIYPQHQEGGIDNTFVEVNQYLKKIIANLSPQQEEKITFFLPQREEFLNLDQKIKLNRRYVNLNEVVQKTTQSLIPEIAKKNIHLNLYLLENLEELWLDEKKIREVFLRLIHNAIYLLSAKGHLIISTGYRSKDWVDIKLADTGRGFKKEVLNKILAPTFSLGEDNLGLNLFVSLRIIEAHGGGLEIESFPHRGTVVEITLPVKQ